MKITRYLSSSPLFALEQAQRGFYQDFQDRLSEEALSSLQAWVLLAIYFERPIAVPPSKLAETLGTTRSNLSHCVSSLEKRKLLRRQLNPNDSRSYHLSLRHEGAKLVLRLIRLFDRAQSGFEKQSGPEKLKNCIELFAKLKLM
jgi:DNA-binding MarR family transcriptional regulator